jgi:NADH dehydrogenase [ubiquinone] 1 alpha subcomplex assembly factor 7
MKIAKLLKETIKLKGPLTVAEYMSTCLVHPWGYYNNDVFGTKGDFVTSPEISQIFGEIIGIWFAYNCPAKFNLVELGPGRGTLLFDVLSVFRQLNIHPSTVHIVEQSEHLRSMQRSLLSPIADLHFHNTIDTVPKCTNLIITHEFFDALPIHKFQMTPNGWRELLVDYQSEKFHLVLSPTDTIASKIINRGLVPITATDRAEVSFEALDISKKITSKMDSQSKWLLIDYGQSSTPTDTLRVRCTNSGHQEPQVCRSFCPPRQHGPICKRRFFSHGQLEGIPRPDYPVRLSRPHGCQGSTS